MRSNGKAVDFEPAQRGGTAKAEHIPDPDATKPEDWDKAEHIPDPDATKPEDWDDEMDGEWEPPMIDNPEFKGEWQPKQLDNPNYKGAWEHPEIANPEYVADDKLYLRKEICTLGFDLWQVKSGTVFDNVLIKDDVELAAKIAGDVKTTQAGEKKVKEAQDEVQRKKDDEEAKKASDKDDEALERDYGKNTPEMKITSAEGLVSSLDVQSLRDAGNQERRNSTQRENSRERQEDSYRRKDRPKPEVPGYAKVAKQVREWTFKYDGHDKPLEFLEQVEWSAVTYGLNADLIPRAMPELLQGRALKWFIANNRFWETWADFSRSFKEFFLPRGFMVKLADQVRQRKQAFTESFKDYMVNMQTLMRPLDMSREEVLQRIIENSTPALRIFIRPYECRDLDALMALADDFEELDQQRRKFEEANTPQTRMHPHEESSRTQQTLEGSKEQSAECAKTAQMIPGGEVHRTKGQREGEDTSQTRQQHAEDAEAKSTGQQSAETARCCSAGNAGK
ncbi:hypothetical protein KR084_007529 [Drosophila pseudotakahashii]|nr:hypothetical protein KR084_007529 [Drosophila pseudotakahashii]